MSLHVGILPSEPDSDTVAMKKKRMQQHYAQQLEVQMQEQRRQKQADKGQTKSEPMCGHAVATAREAVQQ